LNNIPEIKSLRMAESEFESIKLEYDELLIVRENVLINIFKAQEENGKGLLNLYSISGKT